MPANRKATDEQIISAYEQGGSVWAAGKILGMGGQSVHERLVKLGRAKPINVFEDTEYEYLKTHYDAYANTGKLSELAVKMGRTRHFICRKARELGLTDQKRPKTYIAVWKYMPVDAAEVVWEDFKASKYGLGAYCAKKGFDDLGFSKRMKELFPDEYEYVIELKAPKTTLYRHGRQFEYRVRDDLKRAGYFVMRSPGSKSPVDLLAYAQGSCLMVQCKRGGTLPPGEWNELFHLACSVGAKPILAAIPKKTQRGVAYFEMLAPKDGTIRAQPMTEFSL